MIRSLLNRYLSAFFILLISCSAANSGVPPFLENQKKSIISISVTDGKGQTISSGKGFIVDPEGFVVTNCHIIAKWFEKVENMIFIENAKNEILPLDELLSSRCEKNIAILKVKTDKLHAIKFTDDYKLKKGDRIFIIENPASPEMVVSEGIIEKFNKKLNLFRISTPVNSEKQGSPVFNLNGEAVGILVLVNQKGKNLEYMGSVKDIARKFAPQNKPNPPVEKETRHPRQTEEKVKDKEPAELANEYFVLAFGYDKLKKFEKSIPLYKESVKIKPDFAEAYINLGIAHYHLGHYSDAISSFKYALQLKPDYLPVYIKLGTAYIMTGEYSEACETFKKAVNIEPENAAAHFNMGIAYFLSGNKTAAYKEYLILKNIDKKQADELLDLIY